MSYPPESGSFELRSWSPIFYFIFSPVYSTKINHWKVMFTLVPLLRGVKHTRLNNIRPVNMTTVYLSWSSDLHGSVHVKADRPVAPPSIYPEVVFTSLVFILSDSLVRVLRKSDHFFSVPLRRMTVGLSSYSVACSRLGSWPAFFHLTAEWSVRQACLQGINGPQCSMSHHTET